MRLFVSTEHRFVRLPDGRIYSESGGRGYAFWSRYLNAFDSVVVVARVSDADAPPRSGSLASGENVGFLRIPDYRGVTGLMQGYTRMKSAWREGMDSKSAFLLRIPGVLGTIMAQDVRCMGIPYGVEVVGDPASVFDSGSFNHPLRRFIRWKAVRSLRMECEGAIAASYVTKFSLQRLYPPSRDAFTTHYSSVELPEEAYVESPRSSGSVSRLPTLVAVGTMSQRYKGFDVLIDAVTRIPVDVRLVLVGDGKHRQELEAQVANLGLGNSVKFTGHLPAGEPIRQVLDEADLFVLPSRTEGLPRAMVEAMARGLPCIGTNVGGIPELLPGEDMVPRDDPGSLARLIRRVLTEPDRMARMSARNLAVAREYHADILQRRRSEFYRELRRRTEEWLARR